ncbi:MAG: hypothetical protein H6R15_4308 [Proteobacteria bacterium]|nr:hypothetical protein [Pseudomonadota bacterium]
MGKLSLAWFLGHRDGVPNSPGKSLYFLCLSASLRFNCIFGWMAGGNSHIDYFKLITALTSSASVRTPIFSMTRARWASTVFMLMLS